MTTLPIIRVFVSSPGDVAEERVIAQRVLGRVANRFAAVARVEPIFWEHEPLLATDNFQAQIPPPSAAEVFVCILWSRLGTRLPASVQRTDGSRYQSGTEFEFEDAIAAFRSRGMPDLIVYRKTAEPVISLRDRDAVREALRQGEMLDAFIRHWFHGADGTLQAAFHAFKEPSQFEEHLEMHLLKLIGKRVQQTVGRAPEQAAPARVTWTTGSPYRGLEAFDFEHEAIFFGRTTPTSNAIRALREQAAAGRPFLLVLGASGSGKSSLARAGVLPMLTRPGVVPGAVGWRRAVLRPSDASGDVFLSLATALLRPEAVPELLPSGRNAAELAQHCATDSRRVLDQLDTVLRNLGGRAGTLNLVLLIDQMEELFTLESVTDEQRQQFFAFVEGLVHRGVWVIATLRSDFYHRCAEMPELSRLKAGGGQYDVQPPTVSEIAAMIRQPAVAAGLSFEQSGEESLEDLLADDAVRCPESLPLLSFTLDELYKRRSPENVLRLSVYHQLGRLEGALAHRAGEVFAGLPEEVRQALPRVFRQLVTISAEDDAKVARKPAPTAVFAKDPAATAFVRAFVEARLLTTKQAADGSPIVEMTHEALITRWMPVQEWLVADREYLRVMARVKTAAKVWEESGRSQDRLLARGQPLDEARRLRNAGFALSPSEEGLLEASRRRVRRNQQVRWLAVAGLVLLTLVSGVGFVLAERNGRLSEQNFTQARKTVDEFVTAISHDDLSVIPGLQELRLKFARQAVDRYQAFAANRPRDPEVRAGLAKARLSLGQVTGGIGALEEAIGEMQRAIALLQENVARAPSLTNRTRLDQARVQLARFHVSSEEYEAALPLAEAAIQDLTAVLQSQPNSVDAQYELGLALNARGNCRRNSGIELDNQKAYEDYQKSRDVLLKVVEVHPRKADCYAGIAAAIHNMHFFPKAQKDYRQALSLLETSAGYDRQTLELTPSAPQAIMNNSIGLCNQAAIRMLMGEREAADRTYSEAERAARSVFENNPKVTQYQWNLAYALKSRAQYLSSVERFTESERLYEESCRILDELVTRANDRPQYAVSLMENRLALAEFYRGTRAGKKDEEAGRRGLQQAIDTGKRLCERFPKAVGVNYQLAQAYYRLGVLDQSAKRDEAAMEGFREAIKICQDRIGQAGFQQYPGYQAEFLGWIDGARYSADRLGKTDEILEWIATGERLGTGCAVRSGKQSLAGLLNTRGSIHQKAGRYQEAITAYKAGLEVARPAWEEAKWHWYLLQAVAGAYLHLGELYQLTGNLTEEVRARQEWLRIWGGPLQSYNTVGLIDPDPAPSEEIAGKLREEMGKKKGMKKFTVPCDFNGVKYPFDVYIMDVRWPKDPLEDQARWLEEERGGTIPEPVRESFRKLHKLAHDNNVSYQDLCVYALGTASKRAGSTAPAPK